MDIACATRTFAREPFDRALRHLAELEFARVDLEIADGGQHVTADEILSDPGRIVQRIRQGPTLGFAALTLTTRREGEELLRLADSTATLARLLATTTIVVDAAPASADFEAEVVRLGELGKTVGRQGIALAVSTRVGTLTEDAERAMTLCERVDGLSLCLDPSCFLTGPAQDHPPDEIYPFVRHTHLRDSGNKPEHYQMKIGRGQLEFSRIVQGLRKTGYTGALAIDMVEGLAGDDFDMEAEVRKLRLLLETLL